MTTITTGYLTVYSTGTFSRIHVFLKGSDPYAQTFGGVINSDQPSISFLMPTGTYSIDIREYSHNDILIAHTIQPVAITAATKNYFNVTTLGQESTGQITVTVKNGTTGNLVVVRYDDPDLSVFTEATYTGTPYTFTLPTPHFYEILWSGMGTATSVVVNLATGNTKSVTLTLQGLLQINVGAAGSYSAVVNGTTYFFTSPAQPATKTKPSTASQETIPLNPGTYTIPITVFDAVGNVLNTKNGVAVVSSNNTTVFNLSQFDVGTLEITASSSASISINGNSYSLSTKKTDIHLSPGTYTATILQTVNSQTVTSTRSITIVANQTTNVAL